MPDLASGFVYYVIFLLSTTVHEASHALAAKLGGDLTAYHGGQVTLDPRPHVAREPFGMVILPVIAVLLSGWPSRLRERAVRSVLGHPSSAAGGMDGARRSGRKPRAGPGRGAVHPSRHPRRRLRLAESRSGSGTWWTGPIQARRGVASGSF